MRVDRTCMTGALAVSVVLSTVLFQGTATAAYPERPISIIVPYSPGGLGDTFVRRVGKELSTRLGQPVIIDNKPGANTLVGATAGARAAPDGYTLLFASMSTLALNAATYKELPYDPVQDFAPVSLGFYSPLYLVVNAKIPAKTVDELVDLAKGRDRPFAYASTGNGGAMHVVTEQFRSEKGIDLIHVPYKGSNPGLLDVVAGQVQMMFDVGANSVEHAKAGRLRILAVTGPRRTAAAPDVPTLTEAGVPGFDLTVWFGFVAPAGTPPDVVERLSREIAQILELPEFQNAALASGYELASNTPAEFSALIRKDLDRWQAMVQTAGVTPQ